MTKGLFLTVLIAIFSIISGYSQSSVLGEYIFDTPQVMRPSQLDPQGYSNADITLDEKEITSKLKSKAKTLTLPYFGQDVQLILEPFKFYTGSKNPNPEIETFRLYSSLDNQLVGTMLSGPSGLAITFINGQREIASIYSSVENGKRIYKEEIGTPSRSSSKSSCSVHDHEESALPSITDAITASNLVKRFGSTRRVFRIAVATTAEFYNYFGPSEADVRQRALELINAISFVYEKELNIRIVPSDTPRTDYSGLASLDAFEPVSFPSRSAQAGMEIRSRFTDASSYDIGHVFSVHVDGDAFDQAGLTGGEAAIGSACKSNKANAFSGSYFEGVNAFVNIAAHEIGHQFGALHTWNGSGGQGCDTNQYPDGNAYEIGSGLTLMSYVGVCAEDQNILQNSEEKLTTIYNYFHASNLEQIVNYLESGVTDDCNTDDWEEMVNIEPIANANPCDADLRIPTGASFFLTAEATDGDDTSLTYNWEQYDEGGQGSQATKGFIGAQASNSAIAPIFRGYPPSADPTRHFPSRKNQVKGYNFDPLEVLPLVPRNINFRLTVRDNNPEGGALNWADRKIEVVEGNYNVLSPNGGETFVAGDAITVRWNLDSTEDLCDKATIRLSTNNGASYSFVLAENVDFKSGAALVTIPASISQTFTGKIQVSCSDYDCFGFYDYSDRSFIIASGCSVPSHSICDTELLQVPVNDPLLNLDLATANGDITYSYSTTLSLNSVNRIDAAIWSDESFSSCVNLAGNRPTSIIIITPTETGDYNFEISSVSQPTDVSIYSIFELEGLQLNNACNSFVSSNAYAEGGGFVPSRFLSANLEACKEYVIAAINTGTLRTSVIMEDISGPSDLLSYGVNLNNGTTFIAMEQETKLIVAINDNADFRSLEEGEYLIYAINYTLGINTNAWLDSSIEALLATGDCIKLSADPKPLLITTSCEIDDLTPLAQSECDPLTNTYTQMLSLELNTIVTGGNILVRVSSSSQVQEFELVEGLNIFTLTDLLADGQDVSLNISLSEDAGCSIDFKNVFVAPETCCTIESNLMDQEICEGNTATLDAGDSGISYTWSRNDVPLALETSAIEIKEEGTYKVTITDANDCRVVDEIIVTYAEPTDYKLLSSTLMACDQDPFDIGLSIDDFDRIIWTKDGQEVNFADPINPQVEESGRYCFTIVSGECEVKDSIDILLAMSTLFDLGQEDLVGCDGVPITIDTDISDVVSFIWTEESNPFTILSEEKNLTVESSGTYILSIVNEDGCTSSDTLSVKFEELVEVDLGDNITECDNVTFQIGNENWPTPVEWIKDGTILQTVTEAIIKNPTAGEWIANIAASEDCIGTDTIIVTLLDSPEFDLGSDTTLCGGMLLGLAIELPDDLKYEWAVDDMPIVNESNQLEVSQSGNYMVTVTNRDGCSAEDAISVDFSDAPSVTATQLEWTFCEGAPSSISVESNVNSVIWFFNGQEIDNQNNLTLEVNQAGEYFAAVGFNQVCESRSDIITVVFNDQPNITDLGDDKTICEGESILLNGGNNADYSYTWFLNGSILSEDAIITVVAAGEYILDVRDRNMCIVSDTINVMISDAFKLELPESLALCADGDNVLTADTEEEMIVWFLDGIQIENETGRTIKITTPGTYTAVVAFDQECEVRDQTIVTLVDSPKLEELVDATACEGEEITLFAGQDGLYTYTWFLGSALIKEGDEGTLIATESGVYTIIATNTDNCESRIVINVEFLFSPILEISTDSFYCEGDLATIDLNTNATDLNWYRDGLLLEYQILTSTEIEEPGLYLVIAGEGTLCEVRDSVEISFTPLPTLNLSDDLTACEDVGLLLSAGDDGAYIYTWRKDGEVIQSGDEGTLQVKESGTYIIEAIEGDCISVDSFEVVIFPIANVTLETRIEFCEEDIKEITAMTTLQDVVWFKDGERLIGATSPTISIMDAGEYEVVTGFGQLCEQRALTQVIINPTPDIELPQSLNACQGVNLLLTGGIDGVYDYTWTDINGQILQDGDAASISVNVRGTYILQATSAEGCMTLDSTIVDFLDRPTIDVDDEFEFCIGSQGQITASILGANSITWFKDGAIIPSANTSSLTVLLGGEYRVVANLGSGCQEEKIIQVSFIDRPVIDIEDMYTVCEGDELTLVAGPDNLYTYTWTDQNGSTLSAGPQGSLLVTQSGLYTISAQSSTQCATSATVEVEFISKSFITIDPITEFCASDAAAMLAPTTNASSLTWFFNGTQLANESEITLDNVEAGTYEIVADLGERCEVSATTIVTLLDSPDVSLEDRSVCEGETVTLMAGPDNAYTYVWYVNDIQQNNSTGSISISEVDFTGMGVVRVEASDATSCITISSSSIEFITTPQLTSPATLEICDDEPAIIEVQSSVNLVTWFKDGVLISGASDLLLEVTESGLYEAVVGLDQLCERRTQTQVTIFSSPTVELFGDLEGCIGEPISLTVDTDMSNDVSWEKDGVLLGGQSGTALEVTESGLYTAIVQADNNCQASESLDILFYDLPELEVEPIPSSLCDGVPYTVNIISNANRIEWVDTNGVIPGATDLTFSFVTSGDYKVIAYNEIDCAVELDFRLSFLPLPEVDLGEDIQGCEGDMVELSIDPIAGVTYNWYRDGLIIDAATGSSLSVAESGVYELVVMTADNCLAQDLIEVGFGDVPSIEVAAAYSYCKGESVEITVETDGADITWLKDGVFVSNDNPITISEAGLYRIEVSSGADCFDFREVNVTEIDLDQVMIDDVFLCATNDPFTVTISEDFDTYTWSGSLSSNGPELVIAYKEVSSVTTEAINFTGTSNAGCMISETFEVTYYPALEAIAAMDSLIICEGEEIQLSVSASQSFTYNWTNADAALNATDVPNPIASPTETTTYTVDISGACPTESLQLSVFVEVLPAPIAFAGEDVDIPANEPYELGPATGGISYEWSFEGIEGPNEIPNPFISIDEPTIFTVTVTDSNGCSATDDVSIGISGDTEKTIRTINMFTPNGDDVNDVLEFEDLENYIDVKLVVFTRSGNIVFEKEGYQQDAIRWDGTLNGQQLPSGTYYYILEYDGIITKSNITLLRE